MSTDWSPLVLLAAEFTFAVLFLRALFGYLRRRDPLQRDVTLVFLPCTVLFCLDLVSRLTGGPASEAVAAVHTVEDADRHDRPAPPTGHRFVTPPALHLPASPSMHPRPAYR